MQYSSKLGFEETRKLKEKLMEGLRSGKECSPYTRKRLFYTEQRLAVIAARLRLRGEDCPPRGGPN